ncbi:hypothetical protein CDCA_CDCA04G1380 [Cyanidium caldarium]|uniref:Generative cell specific-1/HAP2 domain-containing protein n=1 Tax=Cyanidium caldarium TaxID=2771 RepID=A0AAV9IST3_CYACA|nr:hypothetical protein CDCA_CDCA04G1380 [Cyanidium caldarium]
MIVATKAIYGNSTASAAMVFSNQPQEAYLLKKELQISLVKSEIVLHYPVYYVRDFNNQPSEVIYSSNAEGPFTWLSNQCVDSWSSSDPTCGYAYSPPNSTAPQDRILYSQGFCCRCSTSELLGLSSQYIRGGLKCDLLDLSQPSQSAHCLRFDSLWYSAFQIGTPNVDFSIQVNVTTCDYVGNDSSLAASEKPPPSQNLGNRTRQVSSCSTQILQLSPGEPYVTSLNGKLSARAIGDFDPWEGTPSYVEKWLFVPSICTDTNDEWCLQRISMNSTETARWMLIDTTHVTLSGADCDKIGVSYSAFANEGNRCGRLPQSCLHDQLQTYYETDLKILEAGATGNYFVTFFGRFDSNGLRETDPLLRFKTNRIQATEVRLEFAADDIFDVVNVANGRFIKSQSYVTTAVAQSRGAELHLALLSEGSQAGFSQFTVSALCGPFIAPIPAQTVTLAAGARANVTMSLDIEDAHAGSAACNCTLVNSVGISVDSIRITFNVSARDTSKGAQGGSDSRTAGNATSTSSTLAPGGSCSACGGFFDITCFLSNVCLANIFAFSLVIVGLLLILCCFRGVISKMLCCCCRSEDFGGRISRRPAFLSLRNTKKARIEGANVLYGADIIPSPLRALRAQTGSAR